MKNFVITIARGFGSGGRQIAAMLADELHIHSYNNRILTLASQYSGYPEHYFKEADETLHGSLIAKQLLELPKMFHTKGICPGLCLTISCSRPRKPLSGSWRTRNPA